VNFDEDVNVQRLDRFEIECRGHCAADGITLDNAIVLHLVNRAEYFFDLHASSSGNRKEKPATFEHDRVRGLAGMLIRR
jgi:hypothetical protein